MNHYYRHPDGEPICTCSDPSIDICYPQECMACMRLIGTDVDPYASLEAKGASSAIFGQRIIFLDFDGVLYCSGWRSSAIEALNWLTDQTRAKIVVSSMWRHSNDINELRSHLHSAGVTGQVIGITPILKDELSPTEDIDSMDFACKSRGDEITRWLDLHHADSYIVIDDDPNIHPHQTRWVATEYEECLTMLEAQIGVSMFSQPSIQATNTRID